MPEAAIWIFLSVLVLGFMAVGVLGICKKVKFREKTQSMRKVTGVIVDSTVCDAPPNEVGVEAYFPVYEYEWEGVKKRLNSTTNVLRIKIGRKVHILVDPRTEKAICLEEEMATNTLYMIIGGIGVLVLVMVLMLATGVLDA
ncbi:MAG: hypothetical protein K2H41_15500 [Acetatifactor sp.]|nr:hypothetical protein [Acetatifactor sp.]MDE7270583.1 hypothetical protein [Acetatifactor sp.]